MKKIFSMVMCILMTFLMIVQAAAAYDFGINNKFINDKTFALGDVNGDGSVNAMDALHIKASIVGVDSGAEIIIDAADFDADSKCGAGDSFCLKMVISGARKAEDFENGNQVYKLTIGGNDISEYCIVLNEGITDENNSYYAYLNLKKYVEKVAGVSLPLAYGTPTTAKGIYLNELHMESERGKVLGVEGYKYEVRDGELYIEGTYRGNMYAVYEILEEYLGVRFVSNNETFVYKSRTVDIPEGASKEYIPPIVFRHASQTYGSGGAHVHYFPNRLNGTQLYAYSDKRFGTLTGPIYSNAHSFYEYWKMSSGTVPADTTGMTEQQILEAKYASGTFPDAYGWQPCATNKSVYEKLFNGMLECNKMSMGWGNDLHYEYEISVMSFSILDNQYYCTCRNCTAIVNGKKDNVNTEKNEYVAPEGFSGLYLQLYNKAVDDVQAYYPGLRLYGIVYAKDFPTNIKPRDNLVILYCGVSCDNHILGREDCYEKGGQLNGMKNDNDIEALGFWGNLCRETGAELWFWIYPVTYHYYLIGCPNIPNLYWNTKYLFDECNVNGIYYEGGGRTYNFESLKAYATVKLMWDPSMTYEEFCEIVKEYLYIYYGDGYEEIYEYILMQTEAGDQCGTCFINNYDRPGDMYSYEYLGEHYGEMRGLLETARAKTANTEQRYRIDTLLVSCDFMALSALHEEMYVNGDADSKREYTERYTWMYNFIVNNDISIFSGDIYQVPNKCDVTVNPMTQFYENGSRRPGVKP